MKRLLLSLLAAALLLSLSPAARADVITDAGKLRGSDYTDIPALAQALDSVFAGFPRMYTDIQCSVPASAPIGSSSVPPGRTYYVKSPAGTVYSGTSCYIYANAVYAALFGDVPYHGEPGTWSNSRRVGGNLEAASHDTFSTLGVRCGALLRTTPRADGGYSGSAGHSVILLAYGRDTLTYLEGNADGAGLIRVTTESWSAFNARLVSGRGHKISFIVQPTQAYYESLSRESTRVPDLVGRLMVTRSGGGHFMDVPAESWFCSGVELTYGLGLAEGRGAGRFDPNGTMTAAEAVTFCARFLSLYYDDRYDFSPRGAWYSGYYAYCALWGIDTGFVSPADVMTRGQFALLMSRALPPEAREDLVPDAGFSDVSPGDAWAEAVRMFARCGIVTGTGGGLFCPQSPVTRAEAACFLARMADRSLRIGV